MLPTTDFCTIEAMNAINIGARIKALRTQKGLSQSELARLLDIKPQAVQKWEGGNAAPRVTRFQEIANALAVAVSELIKGTVYEYSIESHDLITKNHDHSSTVIQAKTANHQKDQDKFWSNVPLISWEMAGTWGTLMNNIDESAVLEWIEIPYAQQGTFCLRVEDESAVAPAGQKSYVPGEIVAVNPNKPPKNRSTVVVVLKPGTRAVLRQILTDGDRIMYRTINPDWPDRLVEMNEGVSLIGTVTGKWVPED
jgi:transcriptional regulator with XRE-family HTH domain